MYYKGARRTQTEAGQKIRKGPFLILVQSEDRPLGRENMAAFSRKVAMEQCGHFMMGTAMVHGQAITLSGSYGSDGLPVTVPEELYVLATPVPGHLYDAWNTGGGWNGAGDEARVMAEWAEDNL